MAEKSPTRPFGFARTGPGRTLFAAKAVFRPSEQNTFAKPGRLQRINPRRVSSRDLKESAKELRSHLFGAVAFKCPHLLFTETLK